MKLTGSNAGEGCAVIQGLCLPEKCIREFMGGGGSKRENFSESGGKERVEGKSGGKERNNQ